jgi:hypothetical protein
MTVIDGNTLEGVSAAVDEALALAGTIPGVKAARDVAWPPGRGWFKVAAWPPLERIGPMRGIRPSTTVLEFA